MPATRLTAKIAYEVTSDRYGLERFLKSANHNEYYPFCHTNFFYSFPEFGKKWPCGLECQYHKVETACNCCGKFPDRNYAGYGTLFAYKSREKFNRIVLFCNSCKQWRDSKNFNQVQNEQIPLQLKLAL